MLIILRGKDTHFYQNMEKKSHKFITIIKKNITNCTPRAVLFSVAAVRGSVYSVYSVYSFYSIYFIYSVYSPITIFTFF